MTSGIVGFWKKDLSQCPGQAGLRSLFRGCELGPSLAKAGEMFFLEPRTPCPAPGRVRNETNPTLDRNLGERIPEKGGFFFLSLPPSPSLSSLTLSFSPSLSLILPFICLLKRPLGHSLAWPPTARVDQVWEVNKGGPRNYWGIHRAPIVGSSQAWAEGRGHQELCSCRKRFSVDF